MCFQSKDKTWVWAFEKEERETAVNTGVVLSIARCLRFERISAAWLLLVWSLLSHVSYHPVALVHSVKHSCLKEMGIFFTVL